MKNGYWQKILREALTNRKTRVEHIGEEDLKSFIGGAGLGAEILRRELPARLEPYESRNLDGFRGLNINKKSVKSVIEKE